MEKIKGLFSYTYCGNSMGEYCTAGIMAFTAMALIWAVNRVVIAVLRRRSKETAGNFDDFLLAIIDKSVLPVLYLGSVYFALNHLKLGEQGDRYVDFFGLGVLTIFGLRALARITAYLLESYLQIKEANPARVKNIRGMIIVLKVFIWGIGIILLLDNFGYKVSAILAGLGIGGIAVALAAQAILGDLFSYFSILFDRPFEVGDFIIVGDQMGTVETIGIKTTRLRSLSGEEIIFSNSDLTGSRVRNYKRMFNRRVVFSLGVTYGTPKAKLERIPSVIKSIIDEQKGAKFDRSHFFSYGDFSLNFETVYYVEGNDYNRYMDIQQDINLKVYGAFEKEGIEFAFPTRTVHVSKDI